MKIRTLIPAMLALVMLVGGPFGLGTPCDTDPHGGFICYCGCSEGENCTMISCSGCCGAHAGASTDRSPEMILESVPATIRLKVVYGYGETIRSPETVYPEVPDKPPKKA